MTLDALRDGVGMVLALQRGDWSAYTTLAERYGFDDRQRPLVNQLAALAAKLASEDDLDGFAAHMAGRGDE